ncbi:MAG TPA: trypsin-like serine protease [Gaiellaceae bacterium]|nr:trypsin-like serine protease [Gaiellaceae bacterium]
MRRRWTAALAAAFALAALTGTASALIGAAPDGGAHPYVGMAVWFPDGNPADGFELCSGALLSPTVFVTAAHCFPTGATVSVDFEENALADLHAGGGVPGTVTADPNWSLAGHGLNSDVSDVAVVQLAAPVSLAQYAALPAVGYDDTLKNNQAVDDVAYGVQNARAQTGFGVRQVARQKIVPGSGKNGADFLKISSGTTCFGDSGGPNLQAGTNLVLAVNGYGASGTCSSVAYSQRLDTPEAHAFVAGFLR